ncbi:pesticin C-terminus-like muramidase [Methylobacter sp.]|uniref:pesticin C-terminus-like muramidase n=1 Tax=Methylobacter sp. TaxID=2051955 RepID=UPI003DA246FE
MNKTVLQRTSGVTIGTDVDLGAISDETKYLKRLEDAGVSQETRDRIKPFLGKKRADHQRLKQRIQKTI